MPAVATAWSAEVDIIPEVVHNMILELRWRSVAEKILGWLTEWELPLHPICSRA